jgi:hypothetical protein
VSTISDRFFGVITPLGTVGSVGERLGAVDVKGTARAAPDRERFITCALIGMTGCAVIG